MNETDKIYVAGHRGLVGSAILRRLRASGFTNITTRSHGELDLADQVAVAAFFAREKPKHVLLAAARVGGILANATFPAEFIHANLAIQTNVLHQCYLHGVERLLFLGSSCIYPRDCPQPIKEEYLLTGSLERTNSPYAIAKIAGIEMCHAYNRQYGTKYLCAMPSNLYGPGDNFDLNSSHVVPAMIRKFHEAKCGGTSVVLWGSGSPRREFLHVDDLADACMHLMTLPMEDLSSLFTGIAPPLVNMGSGEDITVRELAAVVADVVGYTGRPMWDSSKPDGTPRKLLDSSRLRVLGWQPKISLRDGIKSTYGCLEFSAGINA